MDFSGINYLAVLVAALASFALGSLWYSPLLFGKDWQSAVRLSNEDIKGSNMFLVFGSSFLLMFIMAIGLSLLFKGHTGADATWLAGLIHGIYVGIFFIATSYGVNLLYQRKTFKLWAIDAGYQITLLGIMGAIIGAW